MKSLVIYPKNGLANRLRALASAGILAECTGRNLFANWIPSKECNVEWNELFLNQLESHPLPLSSFEVGINLYDDSVIPMSWYRDIPRLSVCDESCLVAVHTCRNFQPEEMTNEGNEKAKSLFYRNLRPVDAVRKAISDIQKRYFDGRDVIGVHIRRKDHLTFLKKDHRLVCPTKLFVEAMENILHANPETKFFLATDDQREEKHIRRLFPDKIIVYEKEGFGRNTTKGIQDALVDWVLLSKTSRIIASYASSFSQEAGVVNRIKTDVILREEELSKTHFKMLFTECFKKHYRALKK
ncbi:MAG: hypothetical protein WC769_07430 [Thermodesulfovibrionales bacterium]|jgi:hypothetical protein